MNKEKTHESYIEREKRDAEEFLETLKRVPENKKDKVLGMVEGYALAVTEGSR